MVLCHASVFIKAFSRKAYQFSKSEMRVCYGLSDYDTSSLHTFLILIRSIKRRSDITHYISLHILRNV